MTKDRQENAIAGSILEKYDANNGYTKADTISAMVIIGLAGCFMVYAFVRILAGVELDSDNEYITSNQESIQKAPSPDK